MLAGGSFGTTDQTIVPGAITPTCDFANARLRRDIIHARQRHIHIYIRASKEPKYGIRPAKYNPHFATTDEDLISEDWHSLFRACTAKFRYKVTGYNARDDR